MSIVKFDDLTTWDRRYLRLAEFIATEWSKDPSTKTGAVITDSRNRPISHGINGFPQRIADDERLHDRNTKYEIILHCEINALIFAQRDLTGCTLYTWPFMSCSRCAAAMIQAGITRAVAPTSDNPRWQKSFELSRSLFEEAGVELIEVDCG